MHTTCKPTYTYLCPYMNTYLVPPCLLAYTCTHSYLFIYTHTCISRHTYTTTRAPCHNMNGKGHGSLKGRMVGLGCLPYEFTQNYQYHRRRAQIIPIPAGIFLASMQRVRTACKLLIHTKEPGCTLVLQVLSLSSSKQECYAPANHDGLLPWSSRIYLLTKPHLGNQRIYRRAGPE